MWVDLSRIACVVAVAAAAAAGAGCGGDDDPIRIGLLTDCRGVVAGIEERMLSGAELPLLRRGGRLVDGTIASGVTGARVAGRDTVLVRGCTEAGEHAILIEQVRRLVEGERVDAVVGPLGESDSIIIREVARKYPNVVFLPAWSGPRELTTHRQASNLYRFDTDEAQDVAGLGTFAYRDLGWRTAAIVSDFYAIGWQEEAAFVAEFCALGGNVVRRSNSAPEFQEALHKDASLLSGVDGVAVLTSGIFHDPSSLITDLAARLGTPAQRMLLGAYVIDDSTILPQIADALRGVVGASSVPPPNARAGFRRFQREHAATFPGLPATAAAELDTLAYHDNMEGLLRGLEAVDGDVAGGRRRLREALTTVEADLPGSHVRLDHNRHVVRDIYLKRIGGKRAGKQQIDLVRVIPQVDQAFGGLLADAPPPGPGSQPCRTAPPPPWAR